MAELLNYKLKGDGPVVILLHGLFGNLDNLGLLARDLEKDHQVLSVDLRNHGLSFRSENHTYAAMAEDVAQLLTALHIEKATIVGHSMGGKVAMRLAADYPDVVNKLVVMDMAPVAYSHRKHDSVFAGLRSVMNTPPTSRSQALEQLAQHIELDGVRQFLAKSLYTTEHGLSWRFNVDAIWNNYWNILGWEPIAQSDIQTLFLKGANSDYLIADYQTQIQAQFSQAKAHVIANTGHWLHAEKPQEVLRAIRRFID